MTILQRAEVARRARLDALRVATLQTALDALDRLIPEGAAYVYGSLLRAGRFHDRSDVDIALEREPEHMSIYRLQAELEDAIGRPVDLCLIGETRFGARIRREGLRWTK
ncbi:MAG: nucleotidyltransferase domain-containing protein [Armatimonadetes bacterium]|nr:nucleotidyltransferase domain-containing protein [Armatimonadota bacterium]